MEYCIKKTDKIFVAGHRGLVGSAIVRNLESKGYTNIVTRTHKELDLKDQAGVNRFFDEEKPENQRKRLVVCLRQNEMWWHDLLWFVGHVEKLGSRAWMFSDYGWHHPEFIKKCPKSILQSNWYYNEDAQGYDVSKMKDWFKPKLRLFADLDKAGFDQVPCPSNWMSSKLKASGRTDNSDCAGEVVKYCRANIAPERLKGFMMASWAECKTEGAFRFNCAGMDQLAAAMDRG